MYQKALAIEREFGHEEGVANIYGNLGVLYQKQGKLEHAYEMHQKALTINKSLCFKEGMAYQYCNLGILYQMRGDLVRAEEMYQKSLYLLTELKSPMAEKVLTLLSDLRSNKS